MSDWYCPAMFFPIAFLIGVLGGGMIYIATTVCGHLRQISQRITLALLWFWAAGVVFFTFGTSSGGGQALNLKPLDVTNFADLLDAVLNVLMFAPGRVLFLALLSMTWVPNRPWSGLLLLPRHRSHSVPDSLRTQRRHQRPHR